MNNNKYGDYLFETIKFENNKCCFLTQHLERMKLAAHLFGYSPLDMPAIKQKCQSKIDASSLSAGVVKIIVLRDYSQNGNIAIGNKTRFTIEILPSTLNDYSNISLYTSDYAFTENRVINNLKHGNRLEYSLASYYSNKEGDSNAEVLILDCASNIVDCLHHSIFWVSNGVAYTPSLITGALDSISRRELVKYFSAKLKIHQVVAKIGELYKATEVFVSNSVSGVKNIVKLDAVEYNDFSIGREADRYLKQIQYGK